MPGRKSRTLPQLIRSYGIDRALDLLARHVSGKGLINKLGEAYPAATPGTLRELVGAAQNAREAARATPKTTAQKQAQRAKMPVNSKQPKQYQYYTRTTVSLGGTDKSETWNIRIDSSTQVGHDVLAAIVAERVEQFRTKAIGQSRERIRNSLVVDEFAVVAITRKVK